MNANPADPRPSLADLVRDLTGVGAREEDSPSRPVRTDDQPSGAALSLDDLISDDNGEIVFFNDGGYRSLSIDTEAAVLTSGQVKDHMTAAGDNVSGFNYVTFDNGLTLFFDDSLELILPQS